MLSLSSRGSTRYRRHATPPPAELALAIPPGKHSCRVKYPHRHLYAYSDNGVRESVCIDEWILPENTPSRKKTKKHRRRSRESGYALVPADQVHIAEEAGYTPYYNVDPVEPGPDGRVPNVIMVPHEMLPATIVLPGGVVTNTQTVPFPAQPVATPLATPLTPVAVPPPPSVAALPAPEPISMRDILAVRYGDGEVEKLVDEHGNHVAAGYEGYAWANGMGKWIYVKRE